MKAMRIIEQKDISENPLEPVELPVPEYGENEVLIRITACGVCHTDLHEAEGDIRPRLPVVPGHEIIGIVEETGDGVTLLRKGDRVGVAWLYGSCGICKYCRRGNENLCDSALFTGFDVDGGYAEYIKVNEKYAYKIPPVFDDVSAAPLMCAGVIGYRSYRFSEIKKGEILGLFGFGASAHIVIQIARYRGIKTFVFTRSENHKEHARALGADWVGGPDDIPPEKIDRAIIFAPAGYIVHKALNVLDKGGTVAINAVYMTPIPELPYEKLYYERKIISVANVTVRDAVEFLELAGKIPIKTEVTVYPLEEANIALRDMKYSRINGSAVLRIDR